MTAPERRERAGRDRRHSFPGRRRSILLRCTDEEYADLTAAASRSGLTPSGYAAEAAIAAARDSAPPAAEPWREALTEVMEARTQVRRFGTNVNQAVRALNATGEPPEWLSRAMSFATSAVEQLDQAATRLARRLP
jgi:hypothetical protein